MSNDPKTLLQMVGAPADPAKLDTAAVVMIDCQCEYVSGLLPLDGIDKALEACAGLLARARKSASPVIHVAHKGRAGSAFDRNGAGGQIDPRAAPAAGEPVIEKTLPNAFAATALADMLADLGRNEIILAGFMTHLCVSSTARAALDLGLRTTIVANTTATRDLPGHHGGIVEAATLQAASLAALADRFAIIVDGPDQLG